MTIILGIDPGSRMTGYGIIQRDNKHTRYISSGVIKTRGDDFPMRLRQIFDGVCEQVREYQPAEIAIEQVFMHKNAQSALKLGQARGAAMVAASLGGANVSEYSARQVKLAVVGFGGAKKEQVQHMIRYILTLAKVPQEDAADALAVAVCHAHMGEGLARIKVGQSIRRGRVR